MTMVNLGGAFRALFNPAANAANNAANAKTQGAMAGAASNYAGQNKDARETGKRRSQAAVGKAVQRHNLTAALKRPGRKGKA